MADKSEKITIRVSAETAQRLKMRADAERTTVTALLTEAAERDPRLELAAARFRELMKSSLVDEFAAAFPDEEPDGNRREDRAA
ncbi:hypothetical protein G6045_05895 [Streptomyces sp. YC504]|uniref:Ribbon-helix-helix protein, CopG family n=1 Tax=Streptomyces mesophilus TaxID=1775132 RepID=A0A6G4XCF4_9ACTN|nr:hypothetical protein [Streptomyces mesophilus]NGO75215.1 hypothetical protein [Streptomyces mesophilus]